MALVTSFWAIVRRRRDDVGALAAIVGATLMLFNNAILRGWTYYEFDTTLYYYPVTAWLKRALSQGHLPLWSQYVYGGFPLFADGETGALYPLNLLLLSLLSPAQAFVWLAVLRYILGAVFCYAFLRVMRMGPVAALVGALTFAFGSFTITQMHHVNVVNSAIWLPLILLFAELSLRGQGWRKILYVALTGASFGVQLLTIHIQPVLMTVLVLVLFVGFRALFGSDSSLGTRIKTSIAVLSGVAVAGLGLGAVQLLPVAELASQSARGSADSYSFATSFGPTPLNLLTILFPYFFRIAGYDYWTLWFRWETTIYVGIAPLLLALVAVVMARRREVVFFGLLALAGLLLSLGDYSPLRLFWLLWHIPGFSFARAPGRFSLILVFGAAVLAAYGMQALQQRLGAHGHRKVVAPDKGSTKDETSLTKLPGHSSSLASFGRRNDNTGAADVSSRRNGIVGLLVAGAAAGVFVFLCLQVGRAWLVDNKSATVQWLSDNYLTLQHQENLRLSPERIYDALLNTLRWQNGRTMLSFAFLLATLAIIAVWHWKPKLAGACTGAVVVLVAVDLLSFALIFHPEMSLAELDKANGTVQFLAQHRGVHRTYTVQPIGPTVPNQLLPFRVATVGGYSSLDWGRYRDYQRLVRQGNDKLLDLWNVRYVVSPRNAPAPGPSEKYRPVYEDKDSVVYENATYLPRAFIVKEAQVVNSAAGGLAAIGARQFDPRQQVVLEAESGDAGQLSSLVAAVAQGGAEQAGARGTRAGRATISSYGPTEVTIAAGSNSDAFLLLTDSFYPGWQVTVDGQAAKIYRADYLFRAVYLPKGRHTVVFSYVPVSFQIGAVVSAVFALFIPLSVIGAWVVERRRAGKLVFVREPALEAGGA